MVDKVSIIVPVYNVFEYLPECVESLINQTYTNIEIILVDDGSNDGSELLCDEYGNKDSRVIVVHKINGGLSSSRNRGMKEASGDAYLFVDSDDYIETDTIEIFVNAMNTYDVFIVHGFWYKDCIRNNSDAVQVCKGVDFLKSDLYGAEAVLNLYRKECFENIQYPESIIHEDVATTYKLFYEADRIAYINKEFYFYRQREGSITKKEFNNRELVLIDIYSEQCSYYLEKGEKELYTNSLFVFYSVLLDDIWNVRHYLNNREEEKRLVSLYRRKYKEIIHNCVLKPRTKILLWVSYFFPLIWKRTGLLLNR